MLKRIVSPTISQNSRDFPEKNPMSNPSSQRFPKIPALTKIRIPMASQKDRKLPVGLSTMPRWRQLASRSHGKIRSADGADVKSDVIFGEVFMGNSMKMSKKMELFSCCENRQIIQLHGGKTLEKWGISSHVWWENGGSNPRIWVKKSMGVWSCFQGKISHFWGLPSGYLTVSHGKSPFSIGKPSINGPSIPWLCSITRWY